MESRRVKCMHLLVEGGGGVGRGEKTCGGNNGISEKFIKCNL
jgi:hypothetical protein